MDMFARNTGGAMISGALNAITGGIERAMRTLQSNTRDATLVLTGGDASRILHSLEQASLHRPQLVLQGLAQLLGADQRHPE
jgi:pantothenate kinase type III